MEISDQSAFNSGEMCEFCGKFGIKRCGRCYGAFYCSKDHQVAHWSTHKNMCKPINQMPASTMVTAPENSNFQTGFQPVSKSPIGLQSPNWCQSNATYADPSTSIANMPVDRAYSEHDKPIDFQLFAAEEEMVSTLSSELFGSDSNFWDLLNFCGEQDTSITAADGQDKEILKISETLQDSTGNFASASCRQTLDDNLMSSASLSDICETIVHDLNKFGICVLDKFVGFQLGSLILDEVKSLYRQGIFQQGELASPNLFVNKESIRTDVTTWVSGREANCCNIGNLIRKLDFVLTTCNKSKNSGILSKYKLNRRTKAMIACYPGDGTHYKRHVDNPCRDGRCITCIYYLNKDWNTEQHGGLLRMFPTAYDSQVANIEPIFDRVIFFWSDKRNPHEVLPAYKTRFAITVWYFDADERDQALARARSMMPVNTASHQMM